MICKPSESLYEIYKYHLEDILHSLVFFHCSMFYKPASASITGQMYTDCDNRHGDFFLIYPYICSSLHHIQGQSQNFAVNQDAPQIDSDMLISITVHSHLNSSLDLFGRYILYITQSVLKGNHAFINCLIFARLVALSKAVSYHVEHWTNLVQFVIISTILNWPISPIR